jgi:hypothetical protein
MKTVRVTFAIFLLCACFGLFAAQTSAQTSLNLNVVMGGSSSGGNLPGGGPPFATVTLSIDTQADSNGTGGCSTTNQCVLVTETANTSANPGYLLYQQSPPGNSNYVFGFNDSGASTINILNCSSSINAVSCGASIAANTSASADKFPGFGAFQYVLYGATVGTGGDGTTLSFDVQQTASNEATPAGLDTYALGDSASIASHVCENNGGVCALQPSTTFPIHGYIGVTPEPGSYLLFGSGLLGLGIFLRKKQGKSALHL